MTKPQTPSAQMPTERSYEEAETKQGIFSIDQGSSFNHSESQGLELGLKAGLLFDFLTDW